MMIKTNQFMRTLLEDKMSKSFHNYSWKRKQNYCLMEIIRIPSSESESLFNMLKHALVFKQ